MNKIKEQKGITLVALIITIIVLLILAVVAIRQVAGDGIIQHAKNSQAEYKAAQEVEQIKLALNEWKIVGATTNKTFSEFMAEKFGADKVQAGSSENEVIVTLASGNKYKVTTSGEVTLVDEEVEEPVEGPVEEPEISITLDKSSITKEITSGSTVTETLTATLNNASGELTWTSSDPTVAEISGEGNTKTITLKKAGTATITVSYGTANATCSVTVTEESKEYSLGTATNVANYGKKVVGYKSKGEGLDTLVWRIFYQDDKNVYLISETADGDYPVNDLSFYTYTFDLFSYNYIYKKKDIVEKYNSGADVSLQAKALMPMVSSSVTASNIDRNIIATAYLCDTAVWDAYTDAEGKADFAIGGPTIELFTESYNACNFGHTITLGTEQYTSGTEQYGYTYGSERNWITTEQNNGIYILKSPGKSWLASPSRYTDSVLSVGDGYGTFEDINGTFANSGVQDSLSARPVVCIPVSNFHYELKD